MFKALQKNEKIRASIGMRVSIGGANEPAMNTRLPEALSPGRMSMINRLLESLEQALPTDSLTAAQSAVGSLLLLVVAQHRLTLNAGRTNCSLRAFVQARWFKSKL